MTNMPMTQEHIDARRIFNDNELNRAHNIVNANNLIGALCVYWSEIGNCLEMRRAFFDDVFEARTWIDTLKYTYENFKMIHSEYIIFNDGWYDA